MQSTMLQNGTKIHSQVAKNVLSTRPILYKAIYLVPVAYLSRQRTALSSIHCYYTSFKIVIAAGKDLPKQRITLVTFGTIFTSASCPTLDRSPQQAAAY